MKALDGCFRPSDAELAGLLALPDTEIELIRRDTFSDADLATISPPRGPANRMGFAVQLCHLRYPRQRARARGGGNRHP